MDAQSASASSSPRRAGQRFTAFGIGLRGRRKLAPTNEAFRRPDFVDLVECLKCSCAAGQREPRQFAAGKDMHVWRHRCWIIKRTRAQQDCVTRRGMVFVPKPRPAFAAEHDIVRLAATAGGLRIGSRFPSADLDKLALDPQVGGERTAVSTFDNRGSDRRGRSSALPSNDSGCCRRRSVLRVSSKQ